MKKIKNISILALCAIFVGVVLGCSGSGDSGGGSDIENDGGNGDNGQEAGWKQPAYMNVTEELGGQRFVEENAHWLHKNTRNDLFTNANADANQYIDGKVVELQKLWQEKNTGSALSNQINTALASFNNGTSIGQNINNNYDALIPVFATMEEPFLSDAETFHAFNASYQKLAAYAYNQSLGTYKNETTFQSNKEMRNMPENYFVDELGYANLTYNELTVKKAKEIMNDSLAVIANDTNTDQALLKKVVELALVNESLYGLNDYAERAGVTKQDFANERSYNYFYMRVNDKINNKMSAMNYNQDDRTM